jgi:hypothetical protein
LHFSWQLVRHLRPTRQLSPTRWQRRQSRWHRRALDNGGKINAVIVGVGGFLGVGEKNVAVPFSSLKVAEKNGSRYLVLETNKEALQTAPGYVYDSGKKVWLPAPKQG